MKREEEVVVHQKDYRPSAFTIDEISLDIFLDPEVTEVQSRLTLRRQGPGPLRLDGVGLELLSLRLDGRLLGAEDYVQDQQSVLVAEVPERCTLESRVRIHPAANTALTGLYYVDGTFLTQCEAEGFRRITYYIDRPDVLARYTVTVHAPEEKFPVLLSNGNLVATGTGPQTNWHWARWQDPFPKPSYLFALVAGSFHCARAHFCTQSGREIGLELYVAPQYRHACDQALQSLQHAMAWDEAVYGREYDLERYLIVATDSFNMGAMENKGLNIFNSQYVLASPQTATDKDYLGIESVIAHEYFHNWTGNRVTIRDWFQLSLKEGLTVFRDQEFSSDRNSRGVQRVADVRRLRSAQFTEDASQLAHPVRPHSYKEINNFYTATVYEKGAEIIRMLHTLLGGKAFRQGMDLYFDRHDGQAVCIEDLISALSDGSGQDLSPFLLWYDQAGTPRLQMEGRYEAGSRHYVLRLSQQTPPTPGQPRKVPLPIPVRLAFFLEDGTPVDHAREQILLLQEAAQEWRFGPFPGPVIPSVLRGFSAPVILERTDSQVADVFLARHDDDPFNRWDSFQRLAQHAILAAVKSDDGRLETTSLEDAVASALTECHQDPAFAAELLRLPAEETLGQAMDVIDVDGIHRVREQLRRRLATVFASQWSSLYRELSCPYHFDPKAVGQRSLRHLALSYALLGPEGTQAQGWAEEQYAKADNMTERLGALTALAMEGLLPKHLLQDFYQRWQDHPLIIDKWFSLQMLPATPQTLEQAKLLLEHPAFQWQVPNRVRALLGSFAANPTVFHAADGSGYAFYAEQLARLDPVNPQTAARLSTVFSRISRFDPHRQAKMRSAMLRLQQLPKLSRDVSEILERCLA